MPDELMPAAAYARNNVKCKWTPRMVILQNIFAGAPFHMPSPLPPPPPLTACNFWPNFRMPLEKLLGHAAIFDFHFSDFYLQ